MSFRLLQVAALAFIGLGLLGACTSETPKEPISLAGPTMGTEFHVKYFPLPGVAEPELIKDQVVKELGHINQLMSTYIADSELSLFNQAAVDEWFPVSQELFDVVSLALSISEQTQGVFDITVASLVDLWGFGPSHRDAAPPEPAAIAEELSKVGYRAIQLQAEPKALLKRSALTMDLSAIAKGYAVDRVADRLEAEGIDSYMVEVGGEIRAKGLKPGAQPWRIAIESPVVGARAIQRIIELSDIAIATSGDYRNYFEKDGQRYSHTIDPQTGYPITHQLASVTVMAKTSAQADALATALMVMGSEKGLAFANAQDLEAFFIVKQGAEFIEVASERFTERLNSSDSVPH